MTDGMKKFIDAIYGSLSWKEVGEKTGLTVGACQQKALKLRKRGIPLPSYSNAETINPADILQYIAKSQKTSVSDLEKQAKDQAAKRAERSAKQVKVVAK